MQKEKKPSPNTFQMVYGIALVAVGIGVFVRIPQVMPKLMVYESLAGASWFIRFCFYLMGIILIGGGIKKLIHYFRTSRSRND